jgi:8-oxo-dGTP pyrophosphatase MutT (NUDIX family)
LQAVAVTDETLHQAGAIAYRVVDGRVEVLLMTSRDTGRWIIPKGNIAPGNTAARAALQEAYEEAGVKGRIGGAIPLGSYTYFKKLPSGEARAAVVEVYLLQVQKHLDKWPEKGERQLRWLPPAAALQLIQEPGIRPLLCRLTELEDDLAKPVPTAPSKTRPKRRSRS